ncbi:hypothetical protein FRC09_006047 [Ceratobasidium sp. 395]|nr:hypothetical protein FRC09_006047 [Ceratobasidium sp. 395]
MSSTSRNADNEIPTPTAHKGTVSPHVTLPLAQDLVLDCMLYISPPDMAGCEEISGDEQAIESQLRSSKRDTFEPHGEFKLQDRIVAHSKYRWENGSTLRVQFLDGSKDLQAKIMKYAKEWTEHANIHFEHYQGNDRSDIRITTKSKLFESVLGNKALETEANKPTMTLGVNLSMDESIFRRHVLHEFGHVLGCVHEHQSPETPIIWDEEKLRMVYCFPEHGGTRDWSWVQRNFLQRHKAKPYTRFDEKSIMIYQVPAEFVVNWSKFDGPLPTTLSEGDKAGIARMYPKKT